MMSPYHPLGKVPEQATGPGAQAPKKRKAEAQDPGDLSHHGDVPSSPLRYEFSEKDFDSTQQLEGYSRRQRYLRSYTFSRKKSPSQKVQDSLRKLKNAAWAVVACNYKPAVAKRITDQLHQQSSKIFASGRTSKFQMPRLQVPECFRMPQIA